MEENMRFEIRRTFDLSQDQAREVAFSAAGNAIGVLRNQKSIIRRVSVEPNEPPITFDGLGGRPTYSLILGDLSAAIASGQRARLIEIREMAKTSREGCEAMGDIAALWAAIKRVAAALLAYGELSLDQLLELVPDVVTSLPSKAFPASQPTPDRKTSKQSGYRTDGNYGYKS
jgi:hypothetical protein